jgi:Protein of unknown function (DUF2867)
MHTSIRHRIDRGKNPSYDPYASVWKRGGMRIPNAEHESRPWRIHAIVPDFTLEDVWALPAVGRAEDFDTVLELMTSADPANLESRLARFLWNLRDLLGEWFDLGRISTGAGVGADAGGRFTIPGTGENSLAERLPDDLRGSATEFDWSTLPFVSLYRTADEYAAEISNRTVHGVMHLAWADHGDGCYQAQMAVYVKPRGLFGKGYMALIKPFRYWIVYPALMRTIERMWTRRRPKGMPSRDRPY